MPQWIKMFAVLLCLVPWLNVAVRMLRPEPALAPTRTEMLRRRMSEETAKRIALAIVVSGELGAVILLVDAFTRKYDAPRGWPIALAVMGLITFGMTSLVYFAIWGRHPARPRVAWAEDFCDACKAVTLDRSPRGAGMHNMMGTAFLGRSQTCRTCGSSVRTLWLWLLLPLVPLGSYRVLPVGEAMAHKSWFQSRRAPLAIFQIAVCYSFVAAIACVVWWLATRTS